MVRLYSHHAPDVFASILRPTCLVIVAFSSYLRWTTGSEGVTDICIILVRSMPSKIAYLQLVWFENWEEERKGRKGRLLAGPFLFGPLFLFYGLVYKSYGSMAQKIIILPFSFSPTTTCPYNNTVKKQSYLWYGCLFYTVHRLLSNLPNSD